MRSNLWLRVKKPLFVSPQIDILKPVQTYDSYWLLYHIAANQYDYKYLMLT